jgi:hypothetical protein
MAWFRTRSKGRDSMLLGSNNTNPATASHSSGEEAVRGEQVVWKRRMNLSIGV